MEPMTLDDLRVSLQNALPFWVEIEEADDGEIVIRTGMVERDGVLVDMEEENIEEDA